MISESTINIYSFIIFKNYFSKNCSLNSSKISSNTNNSHCVKTPGKKSGFDKKKTPSKTPAKSPGCKSNPVTPSQQTGLFFIF